MAVAFGRVAHNGWGGAAGTNPITVTITINAGETVVLQISTEWNSASGHSQPVVSSISGGGTYTKRGATVDRVSGTQHFTTEQWSTGAGAATGASSVAVTFNTPLDANDVEVVALAYTGVLGIGATQTASNSTANPSIALATQDANNYVVASFASGDTGPATAGTGTLRDTASQTGAQDLGTSSTDNTAASASSVTNSITLAASQWAAHALELRSTTGATPKTPGDPVRRSMQTIIAS